MLRLTILCFLPNIMTANLQDTYMEQMGLNPSSYTGKLPYYYGYPNPYPVIPVLANSDQPTDQINLPKKLGQTYKLYPVDKKLNKTKIQLLPYFLDLAYAANQAGLNENTKKKHVIVDDPSLSSTSDESLQELEPDLPSNDGSKTYDEDVSAVNDENVLSNKNNLSKLSNTNLPVPVSTGIPINEAVNERITGNIPKLYDEDSLLALSTKKPKQVNEENSIQITSPTPLYKKIPLPTEQPIYNPSNEDAFLPNNKQKALYNQLPVFTEKPESKKVPNPFSSFPIITESPAEDFFSYDSPLDSYKSNLPVFPGKSLKYWDNARKERLIKIKLVSLILSTKKDLDKQIENIRPIHNTFKSGTMYKIGYLISLINKMNRRLSKLYASVQNNVHSWDAMRMLDTYEKVKSDSELVSDMVKLMRAFLRVKRNSSFKLKGVKEPGERHRQNDMSISWSYYDESLS